MKMRGATRVLLVMAGLVALALAVYRPVLRYGFVHYDDVDYVAKESHILGGLTLDGVRWAFATPHAMHYIPLTWISFMTDVSRAGMEPGSLHLTNLVLHLANVCLVFLVLQWYTGWFWGSVLTAGVFGLHPLGVETVAWIYERKGLLSAQFWLLALLAWLWYLRRPGFGRYVLVAVCFLLALLSKPMALSLPVLLLVLDWWPLGRLSGRRWGAGGEPGRPGGWKLLLAEKVPLFLQAAVYGSILVAVFRREGFLVTPASLGGRAANAAVSYLMYLWKMAWPRGLSVAYLIPAEGHPWWLAALAGVVLAGASLLALASARRRPYLAAGWLWFLAVLFPAIGLLNTGSQSMADRHAYLPLVGLCLVFFWWAADRRHRASPLRRVLPGAATVLLLALAAAAAGQVPVWRNALTLFTHAREVTHDNWVAFHNLGVALEAEGKTDEAMNYYAEAVRVKPSLVAAQINLGALLAEQGRLEEAIPHYYQALRYEPFNLDAHLNLGIDLTALGRYEEAAGHYREVLAIKPDHAQARGNLNWLLSRKGG